MIALLLRLWHWLLSLFRRKRGMEIPLRIPLEIR